jgi:hypothetical protein
MRMTAFIVATIISSVPAAAEHPAFDQDRRSMEKVSVLEARPETPFVARLERWCHMWGMT